MAQGKSPHFDVNRDCEPWQHRSGSKRHVVYRHRLRAWQDLGKDSYWRYSAILGWVQMSLDELMLLTHDARLARAEKQ